MSHLKQTRFAFLANLYSFTISFRDTLCDMVTSIPIRPFNFKSQNPTLYSFPLSPPQNDNLILLVCWVMICKYPLSCYISNPWVNLPVSVLKCLPRIQMFLCQEYPSSSHHLSLSALRPNLHPLPASTLKHNILFKIFQCLPSLPRISSETNKLCLLLSYATLSPLPLPTFLLR